MRLQLISPDEMNADQKTTYDEAVAGKRGSAPAPMLAWLFSPEMARHATRLGETLRFNTMFPAKLSEIAILVTARHSPRITNGGRTSGWRSRAAWTLGSSRPSATGERRSSTIRRPR